MTRRSVLGLGLPALATLLRGESSPTHFAPKAKRVIYLFQSGGPSQMELFDYKPTLEKYFKQELPESIRMGQRLTGMSATQSTFPVVPSVFKFKQHGKTGAWVSELLPGIGSKMARGACASA